MKNLKSKTEKNVESFIKRLHTPDGGFILDDEVHSIVFSEKGDTNEKINEINKINEKNQDEFFNKK